MSNQLDLSPETKSAIGVLLQHALEWDRLTESQRAERLAESGRRHERKAINTLRGRAVAARRAHNPEVGGSSPSPATLIETREAKS